MNDEDIKKAVREQVIIQNAVEAAKRGDERPSLHTSSSWLDQFVGSVILSDEKIKEQSISDKAFDAAKKEFSR